jgi:hypothetical protein
MENSESKPAEKFDIVIPADQVNDAALAVLESVTTMFTGAVLKLTSTLATIEDRLEDMPGIKTALETSDIVTVYEKILWQIPQPQRRDLAQAIHEVSANAGGYNLTGNLKSAGWRHVAPLVIQPVVPVEPVEPASEAVVEQ